MKESKNEKAARIRKEGQLINKTKSQNGEWENNFYKVNGFLVNLQYKNGKLAEIINYGK